MSLLASHDDAHVRPAATSMPSGGNLDNRPVWEPPIFSYAEWMNEEHDKKREAILKYFDGNRARTTDFMDIETEREILRVYTQWLYENKYAAEDVLDLDMASWFGALWKEVLEDRHEVEADVREHDVWLEKRDDGEWVVNGSHHPFKEDGSNYGSCSDEGEYVESRASSSMCADLSILQPGTVLEPDSYAGSIFESDSVRRRSLNTVIACVSDTEEVARLTGNTHPTSIFSQKSLLVSTDETEVAPFSLFTIWS